MLGLRLLAAHLIGDFILQTNEEAIKKFDYPEIRQQHVAKYILPFIPVILVSKASWMNKVRFFVWVADLHYITDSQRWASGEEWPPKPILVDQALHIAQLALLGGLLEDD